MGMFIGKERLDLFSAQRVILAGDDLIKVNESGFFSLRHFLGPSRILVANDPFGKRAIFPYLSRDRRADDRRRAFGPGVSYILSQIPTVTVDDLVFFSDQVIDLFSLLAHALDRAARAKSVVDGPVVVVAELDQHEIARP